MCNRLFFREAVTREAAAAFKSASARIELVTSNASLMGLSIAIDVAANFIRVASSRDDVDLQERARTFAATQSEDLRVAAAALIAAAEKLEQASTPAGK
jgi:hypothetical protein